MYKKCAVLELDFVNKRSDCPCVCAGCVVWCVCVCAGVCVWYGVCVCVCAGVCVWYGVCVQVCVCGMVWCVCVRVYAMHVCVVWCVSVCACVWYGVCLCLWWCWTDDGVVGMPQQHSGRVWAQAVGPGSGDGLGPGHLLPPGGHQQVIQQRHTGTGAELHHEGQARLQDPRVTLR